MNSQSSSTIKLNDPNAVRLDDSGRTSAYFCMKSEIKIDTDLIEELKQASADMGNSNVRICLHDGPDAAFHEMIILEHRGRYYRPHQHKSKGESYHVIEGAMGAFIFDQSGDVVDANLLTPDKNFIYRVGVGSFHAVMPVSDVLIYHESKLGPFLGLGDSIFPDWAPDGNNPDQVAEFNKHLLGLLGLS